MAFHHDRARRWESAKQRVIWDSHLKRNPPFFFPHPGVVLRHQIDFTRLERTHRFTRSAERHPQQLMTAAKAEYRIISTDNCSLQRFEGIPIVFNPVGGIAA